MSFDEAVDADLVEVEVEEHPARGTESITKAIAKAPNLLLFFIFLSPFHHRLCHFSPL